MDKKIMPSVFKTKAWKELQKEALKPPKFSVLPLDMFNPDEKKKAKQMQKIINYMYKNNTNGVTTKWHKVMEIVGKQLFQGQVYGIKVQWDSDKKQ